MDRLGLLQKDKNPLGRQGDRGQASGVCVVCGAQDLAPVALPGSG